MVCQERRIAFGSPSFFVSFGSSRFSTYFATYFYRGEFAELLFCHIVNVVDKGLQVITMDDRFEVDK